MNLTVLKNAGQRHFRQHDLTAVKEVNIHKLVRAVYKHSILAQDPWILRRTCFCGILCKQYSILSRPVKTKN